MDKITILCMCTPVFPQNMLKTGNVGTYITRGGADFSDFAVFKQAFQFKWLLK